MDFHREEEINRALLQQPVDLNALRDISRMEGGFMNNRMRTRVWPKLLNINRYSIPDFRQFIDPHRDNSQVRCDVDRALWNFHETKNWTESFRDKKRKALLDIIMSILCKNKTLYYYQGFHDLVSIFLLVLDEQQLAFALCEAACKTYMIDYMNSDFEIVSKSMRLLLIIIKSSDIKLYTFLKKAKLEPFFATSWLITWFAHDIRSLDATARIYDVMLCSHPVFCFYLCAAYVIHIRDEILHCECDFASLHNLLVKAPETYGFPFEQLLVQADLLFAVTPIERLKLYCDQELRNLINTDRISIISRPYEPKQCIDSDWTLLQRMELKPAAKYPLMRYYVSSALTGLWNRAFGIKHSSSSGDLSSLTKSGSSDNLRRNGSSGRLSENKGESGKESGDKGGYDSSDLFVKNLLWSLAAIVSSILGIALIRRFKF